MSSDDERKAMPAQDCWASQKKSLPGATTSRTNELSRSGASSGRGELVAKIGTVLSAIMASSCCWLPVLLLAVGVSGAGIASTLEAYRPVFMVVTFGFLAMAFYFTYRPRHAARAQADCCSPQAAHTDALQAEADCSATQTDYGRQAATATGRTRFSMMALNKVMLWAVTVLAVVFLFFPQYITGLLGTGNEAISAEMTRSVIKLEGMTCEGWRTKAAQAIHQAPGVLAVNVDYEKRLAIVGTDRDRPVPRERILELLKALGYRGEFVE